MKRSLCLVCLVLIAPSAFGQQAVKSVPLTVSPAKEPTSALKWRLLPPLRDLRPGNAAFCYQRAHNPEIFAGLQRHPDYQNYSDWLTQPLNKFPADKARALLPAAVLRDVDEGARRLHCDWELIERLRKDGFSTLLPEVQMTRVYGSLLALRARLEIHDRQYDRAIRSLQSGYALARHVAEGPTLINALVGIAIAGQMDRQLETLLEQPDAPNLYWSLTNLPRPFIDTRRGLEGEGLMVDAMFPNIRDTLQKTRPRPFSTDEIQTGLDGLANIAGGQTEVRVLVALYAAKVYPEAKKFSLANGWTEENLAALPVTQVALMFAVTDYDRHLEDTIKWAGVPYWEARPRFAELTKRLADAKRDSALSPGMLAQLILPAVHNVALAQVRAERKHAALRCVEALRLHAAEHNGRLPAALADIKAVPVPSDPATGTAFSYRVEGTTAHLEGGAPEGEPASERNTLHYEITLRP